jgi:hypothetical protein
VMSRSKVMAAGVFAMQLVDQWNQVRGGLAAPSFGGRDQIASRHSNGNGAGLNGGGLKVASVFD